MTTATANMDAVIGRRVHQLMWDRKITQTALAKKIGVHQTALSKKLRGERGWSADELMLVASGLHITVGVLFGETDAPLTKGTP